MIISILISEAFMLWLIEQWQIFGFGGTATFTITRSFANIALSCIPYAAIIVSTRTAGEMEGKLTNNKIRMHLKKFLRFLCISNLVLM